MEPKVVGSNPTLLILLYETLKPLTDAGKSIREIAALLGCSYTNIRYWLKKLGLQTKQPQRLKAPICEHKEAVFYSSRKRICTKCINSISVENTRTKRKRAHTYMGGCCKLCGFKETYALDLHHVDPSTKDPTFPRWKSWCWHRIETELQKCVLLCRNCHAGVHAGELSVTLDHRGKSDAL